MEMNDENVLSGKTSIFRNIFMNTNKRTLPKT